MRPKIEGLESDKLVRMVNDNYSHLSPTELVKQLINNHYKTLYPRGDQDYGNIKESETRGNKGSC